MKAYCNPIVQLLLLSPNEIRTDLISSSNGGAPDMSIDDKVDFS